jgi:hypothetical protein
VDLTKALAPKSDQLDFADLDGLPPQVFTITDVSENGTELADQQPVNIRLAEFPRVWRPSKGMLRVLADKWGKDVKVWVGRRVELYGDPEVYFGKEKRGGTRISRLTHLTDTKPTLINPRGGRGAYWSVKPLPNALVAAPEPTPDELAAQVADALTAATTEAEVREWGNRAHARNLLDVQVNGETVRNLVTHRLAELSEDQHSGSGDVPDPHDGNDPWVEGDKAAQS